jgi:ATP-dependent protease Clp ATPase subunit
LDKLVSGQEYLKSILTEAAFRRPEGNRPVLLIGPSPSSQMFLARALAYALGVACAAGTTRGLTTMGPGNLLFDLLAASAFDIQSAQRGVVYVAGVDEVDAQDALMGLWRNGASGTPSPLTPLPPIGGGEGPDD